MKPGLQRFEYYLQLVEDKLKEAFSTPNPTEHLYKQDLRTPMFMLQGLCKLYGETHNQKGFDKLRARFKTMEDALGAIDFYDGCLTHVNQQSNIPPSIGEYFKQKKAEAERNFDGLLQSEGWLKADKKSRLYKIWKRLTEMDWLQGGDETKALKKSYLKEIEEVKDFVASNELPFTEIEDQLHELRRKLRWLSIYTQAFRGLFQYTSAGTLPAPEKYLTQEVLQSRHNVLPLPLVAQKPILLNQQAFYGLSWVIAELGNLKDEGLHYEAITEAVASLENVGEDEAVQITNSILHQEKAPFESILEKGSQITSDLMDDRLLDILVVG